MPAARMPGAFSDDMPELNRQMGCMAGIFQIFDRQRLITGRRGGRQAQKRLPPPPASGKDSSAIALCISKPRYDAVFSFDFTYLEFYENPFFVTV